LLNIFDISNTFHDSSLVNVEAEMCQTVQTTQMLNLVKRPNSCRSKVGGLNWTKVSKMN